MTINKEVLCDCLWDYGWRKKPDFVRRLERMTSMRWLCVFCKRPLLSFKESDLNVGHKQAAPTTSQ